MELKDIDLNLLVVFNQLLLERRVSKVAENLGLSQPADHIVVISEGTGHGKIDELLERSGVERKVRLTVPHFVAVGHLLRQSDMVATVPERLAQSPTGPFELAYVKHPATLPEIAINMFWHAKYHRDPANVWLRNLVFRMHSDQISELPPRDRATRQT